MPLAPADPQHGGSSGGCGSGSSPTGTCQHPPTGSEIIHSGAKGGKKHKSSQTRSALKPLPAPAPRSQPLYPQRSTGSWVAVPCRAVGAGTLAWTKQGSPQAPPGQINAPPPQRLMQPWLRCQLLLPTIRLELTMSRTHAPRPYSQGGPCREPHGLSHCPPVPSYTMTAPSPPPVEGTLAKPFPTSQPEPEIPSGALCVHPRRCPEQSWLTYRASRAQIRLPSTLPDGAVVAASWQQAPSDQSAAKPAPSMSTVWATGRSRRPAAAGAMVGCSWAGSPWQGLLGSPWPPACTGC